MDRGVARSTVPKAGGKLVEELMVTFFPERLYTPLTGTVKLKLHKGSVRVVGRESKYSLYSHDIATYGKDSTFDQKLAKGFVELWGMQSTEANKF